MRALILDDEKKSREVLLTLLHTFCNEITETENCSDVKGALEILPSFKPDLLFMDISLREGDSFELLEHLKNFDFEIIFITAYDEIAVKSLQFCSIPCLMKPIEIEELCSTVSLVKARKNTGFSMEKYQAARLLLKTQPPQLPIFKQNKFLNSVEVNAIENIKMKGDDEVLISLSDGKKLQAQGHISDYESILEPHGFMLHSNAVLLR
jgi:two-component system, LytTR family, response regulator